VEISHEGFEEFDGGGVTDSASVSDQVKANSLIEGGSGRDGGFWFYVFWCILFELPGVSCMLLVLLSVHTNYI
jgi:hypothetical protein